MFLQYVQVFFIAVLSSITFTYFIRNAALRYGWVRGPGSSRHIHVEPTPRLGGVGIFAAILTAAGASVWLGITRDADLTLASLVRVLTPASMIFLLGAVDDLRPLKAWHKFGFQFLVACLLFATGTRAELNLAAHMGPQAAQIGAFLATVFWTLLITNAFNLIDGLDGLAAGAAIFSCLTLLAVSLVKGNYFASLLAVLLAGALIGFLRFNFNPATIFLGDSGSLLIGFMVATIALEGTQQKSSTLVAVALPLVACGFPVLDTGFAVVRRFLRGRPLFSPDRSHIHHKLLEQGFSQRSAVLLLYLVSFIFGMLVVFIKYPGGLAWTLGIICVGLWLGLQKLGYHEVAEIGRVATRTLQQRSVIANNLAIRHAVDEMKTVETLEQLCFVLEHALANNEFHSFRLIIEGPLALALDRDSTLQDGRADQLVYFWSQENKHGPDAAEMPSWTLELECSPYEHSSARLFFHRYQEELDIRLDLNLVTGLLARAVRTTLQEIPERPAAGQQSGPLVGRSRYPSTPD